MFGWSRVAECAKRIKKTAMIAQRAGCAKKSRHLFQPHAVSSAPMTISITRDVINITFVRFGDGSPGASVFTSCEDRISQRQSPQSGCRHSGYLASRHRSKCQCVKADFVSHAAHS